MLRPLFALMLAALLAAGCDINTGEVPPTPTWSFTGPTLQPTPRPFAARPTQVVQDILAMPGQNNPTAAALPADSQLPPRILESGGSGQSLVQMPLRTGETVSALLLENPPIQLEDRVISSRLPGLVLVGPPPNAWGDFPERLRLEGYTVLVIDMGINEAAEDLIDVMDAMGQLTSVNPGVMGVIGAGRGADQALRACASDAGCDALVLLGPLGGTEALNWMTGYNPRPLFLAASNEDVTAYETVQRLAQVAAGEVELALLRDAGRGAEVLNTQPGIQDEILTWLAAWLEE